jgi:uncharacterized protein
MISLKRHPSGSDMLIAACDAELLGKTFEGNGLKLEVSRRFYGGEMVDIGLFIECLALATTANLTGPVTVGAAIEAGFVDPDCVMRIEGVMHAQVYRM